MKRILCVVMAILVCSVAVLSAIAADNAFVPSISYKGSPDIVPVEDPNGNDAYGVILDKENKPLDYLAEDCLLVTPVSEAKDSTKIPEAAKQQLLKVYQGLSDGTMQLPYDKIDSKLDPGKMVIRDLFDISFLCEDHPILLAQDDITVEVKFNLGIDAKTEIYCMVYTDGQWEPAVSAKNNGDGTVTCVFEDLGSVAFAVKTEGAPPPQTGDTVGSNLPLWIAVMAISAAALILVLVLGRRKSQ